MVGRQTSTREVERAVQAMVRAVRARKIYRDNNATLARIMSDTSHALEEALRVHSQISLEVAPDGLVFGEEQVLSEVNPDDSVAFALFRDGIRRLDISEGLGLDELGGLIYAIAQGSSFSGIGDDIVSILWRLSLDHVQYVVVDSTIVDAAANGGGAVGGGDYRAGANGLGDQLDGLVNAIYGGITGKEGAIARSFSIDQSDLAARELAASLDPIDEASTGLFLPRQRAAPPVYAAKINAELERETESELAVRVAEVIVDALTGEISSVEASALSDMLLGIFDAAITSQDLHLATRLISGVAVVYGRSLEEAQGRFDLWFDEAISDARLRGVLPLFKSATPEELAKRAPFFRACGVRAVPILIAALPTFGDAEQRRRLCDLILEIGIDDLAPIEALFASEQLNVADAVHLLAGTNTPEARLLIARAARDPRPDVRFAAVETSDRLLPDVALDLASQLLDDADPRVAAAAARALSRMRIPEAARVIENVIKTKRFEDAPVELKLAYLESFAVLMQAKGVLFLGKLIKDGDGLLTKRSQEDASVAAVQAIVHIRVPRTVEILKAACSSHNKRIRETARDVLMRMKGVG